MARSKKVKADELEQDSVETFVEAPAETVVPETKPYVFNPSEKEVVDATGNVCLEWTDANGCTFKQLKP